MDAMIAALTCSFKSKRLTYIPMSDEDKTFMFEEIWANPVHSGLGNLAILRPITRKEVSDRVDYVVKDSIIFVAVHLTAELKSGTDEDKAKSRVGYVMLRKGSPDGITSFRSASIGMGVAAAHQGKGYGRETLGWVLDYAFAFANLHRVEIGAVSFNERAIALYKSVGFVQEGVKRKCTFSNMQWHDEVMLAMLDEDYAVLRKARESQA